MKSVIIVFVLLIATSCKKDKVDGTIASSIATNKNTVDTVYVNKDSAIVPDNIYLNMDSIKIGETFTDKKGIYGYYRLIFSSSEETQSFHIEKIQIVGDGIVKLVKRFTIPSEKLGLDYESPNINLIKWKSPEIVELEVDNKKMVFDISKMKTL